jgi:alpha-beta hydrolase superfamily lysophospholipase
MSATATDVTRPSLSLLGTEPLRAAFEYARHRLSSQRPAPRGDGHPVVIFPGLGSDGLALAPLRDYCNSLGYHAIDWQLGRNTGPEGDVDEWLDRLAEHTRGLLSPFRKRATLIGWSLGGLYARELAKRMRPRVRQVITLGTPFNWTGDSTNVAWIVRLLKGEQAAITPELGARLREPPPVPTASIFSRKDGVVAWQSCQHANEAELGDVDDFEVEGSHLGMGWNPDVLQLVGERLALRRRLRAAA